MRAVLPEYNSPDGGGLTFRRGFCGRLRAAAADLYDEAFGAKFAAAAPDAEARRAFLAECFRPRFSFAAMAGDEIVGVAGFHSRGGKFTGGGTFCGLIRRFGAPGGCRAALLFALYERRRAHDELLMDGIAVRADRRGLGIGGRLLREIKNYARERGYQTIRLDVIDINPDARRLYERKGFRAVETSSFPFLRRLLGFGGATKMEFRLPPAR